MTIPDTKEIRAQMEPLDGFTPGPWLPHNQPGDWGLWGAHRIHVADASPYDWDQCIAKVEYQTPYCLGEKRSVIEAAKTAACNARLIASAPDMRETILALCEALDAAQAETEQRIPYDEEFDTQSAVERDPCGAHMAIQDMQAEIERLRAALRDVIGCDHHNFYDGVPPKYVRIARAAPAQKGDQP